MKEPLKILLADDDEGDRLLFTDALEQLKFKTELRTVNDGTELMDYLNAPTTRLPDLLFLDLNMPRKNGMECLREIRSNDQLKNLSVAIYSTSASEKDIQDTFVAGANIYMQKPADFELLKKALKRIVTDTTIYQDPPFNRDLFFLRI